MEGDIVEVIFDGKLREWFIMGINGGRQYGNAYVSKADALRDAKGMKLKVRR